MYLDGTINDPDLETLTVCVARAVMQRYTKGWVDPASLPDRYSVFLEAGKSERLEARARGLSYSVESVSSTPPTPGLSSVSSAGAGAGAAASPPVWPALPAAVDPLVRAAADIRVSEARVREFIARVSASAKLEPECLVAALVYFDRLLAAKDPPFVFCMWNWRPVLLGCLLLASKVWDDLSMWNADFSKVAPTFTLARINELEMALLFALRFSVSVTPSAFAKYSFQLRAMADALGLRRDRDRPLDLHGARKLHALSKSYQQQVEDSHACARPRSNTLHGPVRVLRARSVGMGKATASIEEVVSQRKEHRPHVPACAIPTAASVGDLRPHIPPSKSERREARRSRQVREGADGQR